MNPDRVFLDANVLFSVAYGSQGLERLWEFSQKGLCLLFTSGYVVEETRRNLNNPDHLKKLEALLLRVQIVPEPDPKMPCPIDLGGKDQPVLMAAISAKANYFLTGDREHFGKYFGQRVKGVMICRVRDYLSEKVNLFHLPELS